LYHQEVKWIAVLLILGPWPVLVYSQENNSLSGWSLGAAVGPYLPSNIPGVTDVMKAWQGRISWFDGDFGWELWGFRSVEDGAIINYMGGSLTRLMPIPDADGVGVLVSVGIDTSYCRPASRRGTPPPFIRGNGVHFAGGIRLPIGQNLAARTGFSILNGPGRAVMVEVGLEWRLGGAATAGN